MANRLSISQISTILAKTVGNCKPGELEDIRGTLDRFKVVRGPDYNRAPESTLTAIFAIQTVKP